MVQGESPPRLAVIIPAYNESANVRAVVAEAVRVFDAHGLKGQYELVLVDDGSADDTGAIMEELERRHDCVRVRRRASNGGLGEALKTGIAVSRGRYVTFIPGDGEIALDQVVKFLGAIGDADLLVSTRCCSDEATRRAVRPWHREVLSWGHSRLIRLILGFDPKGMDGLFFARGDLLRALPLKSRSGTVCLEIILRLRRQQCSLARSTMDYRPRLSGRSKVTNLRSIVASLWDMLRLRYSLC